MKKKWFPSSRILKEKLEPITKLRRSSSMIELLVLQLELSFFIPFWSIFFLFYRRLIGFSFSFERNQTFYLIITCLPTFFLRLKWNETNIGGHFLYNKISINSCRTYPPAIMTRSITNEAEEKKTVEFLAILILKGVQISFEIIRRTIIMLNRKICLLLRNGWF